MIWLPRMWAAHILGSPEVFPCGNHVHKPALLDGSDDGQERHSPAPFTGCPVHSGGSPWGEPACPVSCVRELMLKWPWQPEFPSSSFRALAFNYWVMFLTTSCGFMILLWNPRRSFQDTVRLGDKAGRCFQHNICFEKRVQIVQCLKIAEHTVFVILSLLICVCVFLCMSIYVRVCLCVCVIYVYMLGVKSY